jgi:2-haloacid dehalogenase
VSGIDLGGFDALTFDCYGTLIDWERGILEALQPVLAPQGIHSTEDELLARYARHEAALEAGPYLSYREILGRSLRRLCEDYAFEPAAADVAQFSSSVGYWPAFADSAEALGRLATSFKLGVITNCDDDLFALSNRRLGVTFDWVVSAQTARSYKPDLNNFAVAFERIDAPRERILHVAQSLFHDHVPAKELGMTTVWIDRRHAKPGFGATPEAFARPDLTFPDLRSFADLAVAD